MAWTPTALDLQRYARDPLEFLGDLIIPAADGPARFKDVWGDFQVEAFRQLRPSLLAVAAGKRPPFRGAWLERTKGASKDSDVGCCILWAMLFTDVPLLVELGAEKRDQAAETLNAMRDLTRLNPWMEGYFEFQVARVKSSRTGSTLNVLTTTDTAGHGTRPNFSVCNELSHISHRQFAETMADNADKLAGNFMVIATNAGSLHTWQYDWREAYRVDKTWYFQKVDDVAPWIPERNIDNARRRNPTIRFNRLWKGIWAPQQGDAIDPEDIEAAIKLKGPTSPKELHDDGWWCILGVDSGVKHDHAALVILAVKPGEPTIRLVSCEWWAPMPGGHIDLTKLDDAIFRALDKLPIIGMAYDSFQMENTAQRVRQKGFIAQEQLFQGKHGDLLAHDLLHVFTNRDIEMYHDEALIRDLHRLCIEENKMQQWRLTAVRDDFGHADRGIAMAIALTAAVTVTQQRVDDEDDGAEHIIEV